MGIHRRAYHGSFNSLKFRKSGKDIKVQARDLAAKLKDKIGEREQRISDSAKQAGMDTAMDVLTQIQHLSNPHSNAAGLTVGIASAVRKEIEARLEEMDELENLELIIRNLPEGESFNLDFGELEYFQF